MIRDRREACLILGIPDGADQGMIKSAYKRAVRLYHPDAGASADETRYLRVTEAYAYLTGQIPPVQESPAQQKGGNGPQTQGTGRTVKVYGQTAGRTAAKAPDNYADFQRKYEKRREEKARDFDRRMKDYAAEQERLAEEKRKEEEEYRRAMELIRSIRLAEAIKELIHSEDPKTGH